MVLVLFPPGGGEGVEYGGKGVLIHTIIDGMPLSCCVTAANGNEREQVLPLLDATHAGKVGRETS